MKRSESTFGTSKSCLKCFFWKGKRTGDSGKVECDINECGLCEIDKKKHANDDLCGDYIHYRDLVSVQKYKQKIREYEQAKKANVSNNKPKKATASRGSKRKSSKSSGGGLLLLIILVALIGTCGKKTTQKTQSVNEQGQTQTQQEQSEADRFDINTESEFIFADSDKRYLSDEEVKNLNKDEIRIAINEIYARRGRSFKTPELNEYFSSKSWYNPQFSQAEFSEDVFNEYEKANINLLSQYR